MINKLFKELTIAFLILFVFMACEYPDSKPTYSANPTPTTACEYLTVDTTALDPDKLAFYYAGNHKFYLEKSTIALTIGFSENFTYNETLNILSDFPEIERPEAYNVFNLRKDKKMTGLRLSQIV